MKQETLQLKPPVPAADALKAVLAFPSTVEVGITSLGFLWRWASLASLMPARLLDRQSLFQRQP